MPEDKMIERLRELCGTLADTRGAFAHAIGFFAQAIDLRDQGRLAELPDFLEDVYGTDPRQAQQEAFNSLQDVLDSLCDLAGEGHYGRYQKLA